MGSSSAVFLQPDHISFSLPLCIIQVKLVIYQSTVVHKGNEIQIELNRLFYETNLETKNAVLVFCIFPGK